MARKKTGRSRLCRATAFLLCLILCMLSALSLAESPESGSLAISLPAEVKAYTWSVIKVTAPADGEALLTLYDNLGNPWLYRHEILSKGENLLSWDGLGAGGELLMSGPFRFDAVLKGSDGREWKASTDFSIRGNAPALGLALPSSDILYLDQKVRWFVECWVPGSYIVALEVLDRNGTIVYSKDTLLEDPDRDVLRWNGVGKDHQKVAPGEYTVRLYAKRNPDFAREFPLTVVETMPELPAVSVTGPVVPERGMSDAEIWEIMMKPSVVISATGWTRRFKLRESPSARSAVVGYVCCATQGLEILAVEGDWAQVRTSDYDTAQIVTGWYPVRELTVTAPARHYGVLVDKQNQTLTVYHDGVPVGTVPVSTGLAAKRHETCPGAFLIDVHFSPSFAQDGARYDYPLRYQGGSIIHSTGFDRIPHRDYSVKDYSTNLPLLGQKASHGCVRVSPFTTEDCPVNSYWLWTHLSYHSRVIVLDDDTGTP